MKKSKSTAVYSKYLGNGSIELECLYCGTMWRAQSSFPGGGGWTGFLEVRVRDHASWCARQKPSERRKYIERTEKRLLRKPNEHTALYFNHKHLGLRVQDPYKNHA